MGTMGKRKSDKNMNRTQSSHKAVGRPKINIDLDIVGNLASIGCTQEEIASVVGVSARTLQRNYADIIDRFKNKGKASLRKRCGIRLSKKTILICKYGYRRTSLV